jgi:hypothetical protein
MTTMFNDLLRSEGIAPEEVRLLRHHTGPGHQDRTVHDLWQRDRPSFETYQAMQAQGRKIFRTARFFASFVCPDAGTTLFVGLYAVELDGTRAVNTPCPYRGELPGGGAPIDIFRTARRPELSGHVGNLKIDWPADNVRTWARYAQTASFACLGDIAVAANRAPVKPDSTRVHYMLAVVRALLANGGSGRPPHVYSWLNSNSERRPLRTPVGVHPERHFEREVRFARQELADGGLIASVDGVWFLSSTAGELTSDRARQIIRENRTRRDRKGGEQIGGVSPVPSIIIDPLLSVEEPARPSTGPRPTTWTATTTRGEGPASTYAFRFQESDLWKIGFASDLGGRLSEINRHVPIELVGRRWMLALHVSWPSQALAFAMEQEVLVRLHCHRTMFERVRCSVEHLRSAWDEAVAAVDLIRPSGPQGYGSATDS